LSQILDRGALVVARGAARCAAQSKSYRLHLHSGKVTFAAMFLRRGLSASAQNLGVGLQRGQTEPFFRP
jgi:hypothetical protein